MRRLRYTIVATVMLLGVATPARAEAGENCAFLLVPQQQQDDVITAQPMLIGCYGTYAEALQVGSGGAIDVSSTTTPQTLTDAALAPDATTSSVLIGTEYDSINYVGASNSYFATATCSSTTTWQLNYVGDAWNDRFESGRGFGGCDHNKKFQDADYLGAVITCTPNCSNYGALGNQVSSLRWKP